jgi:WD40 repeat protein
LPRVFLCLKQNKMVHTLKGHEKVVCGISYHPSPDTNMLVSSSQDGTVRVWGP